MARGSKHGNRGGNSISSSSRTLTAWSPECEFFATAQLAVDSDTVRIFDSSSGTGVCTARWSNSGNSDAASSSSSSSRVTAIAWTVLQSDAEEKAAAQSRGKKRRKSSTSGNSEQPDLASSTASTTNAQPSKPQPVLSIGLSDGSIFLLHPRQSSVVATLSHSSTNASSVKSLAYPQDATAATARLLWSCSSSGRISAWQLPRPDGSDGRLLAMYEGLGAGFETLAVRYSQSKVHLLVAKHAIRLLVADLPQQTTDREVQEPPIAARTAYTGHASEVSQLVWLAPATAAPTINGHATEQQTFASCAVNDRSINIWNVDVEAAEGTLRGTISLDDNVRCLSASASAKECCAVLVSGSAAVVATQASMSEQPVVSEKKRRRKSGVPPLAVLSTISGPADGSGALDAAFTQEDAALRVMRNGVKPVFSTIDIKDESGARVLSATLASDGKLNGLLTDGALDQTQANHRAQYAEPGQSAVLSGAVAVPEESSLRAETSKPATEPTLAQRLSTLQVQQSANGKDMEADLDPSKRKAGQRRNGGRMRIADVTSLSQSLVQALHSSDSKLLESCLEKTNPKIIRNSVKRLPNSLVLPLVEALVERLGRTKQGFGAGSGGVDALRGHALVEWLRHVLTVHLAYLITIPSLVSRLAALYATMEMRIAHHNQLLALNGRLDLVVSQIEMSAHAGPSQQPIVPAPAKKPVETATAAAARKYVEGETSSEESEIDEDADATAVDAEVVAPAEENGDIEDLVMDDDLANGESSGSEGEEEDDEEDDMPALRKAQAAKLNGFLELEAEETEDEYSDEEPEAGRPKKEKSAFSLVNGDLGESDEEEEDDLDRYESDFINDEDSEDGSDGDSE